nr:sulfatase-like hydrolase/transferase [Chloroflexota bacterium]
MRKSISRREFLKLAGALSMSYALPQCTSRQSISLDNAFGENILIIVFDAWSASNIPLFGYQRNTTPHLERLAKKAVVYHNHYAGGHFTTPGTASLLTGTLPWTHQSFSYGGRVDDALKDKNIFHAFRHHHRLAYSHNPYADTLLRQFMDDINQYSPKEELYLKNALMLDSLFPDDQDIASIGWSRALKNLDEGYSYSLYLSRLYEIYLKKLEKSIPNFPRGLPTNYKGLIFFTLEQAIDSLTDILTRTSRNQKGEKEREKVA